MPTDSPLEPLIRIHGKDKIHLAHRNATISLCKHVEVPRLENKDNRLDRRKTSDFTGYKQNGSRIERYCGSCREILELAQNHSPEYRSILDATLPHD